MIFLIIFAVIMAFISGTFLGMKVQPKDKVRTFKKSSENLQNEYHNFLNYDGSVQQ